MQFGRPASMGRRGGSYTIGRKLVAVAELFKRSRSLDCAQARGSPAGGPSPDVTIRSPHFHGTIVSRYPFRALRSAGLGKDDVSSHSRAVPQSMNLMTGIERASGRE